MKASAACACRGEEVTPAFVMLTRWWGELRWGLVRFDITPPGVIDEIRLLQEARECVVGAADDTSFWEEVKDKFLKEFEESKQKQRLKRRRVESAPHLSRPIDTRLSWAIEEAYKMGAVLFFLKDGFFVAPSRAFPRRLGLHTLLLRYPCELVGAFQSEYPWAIDECNSLPVPSAIKRAHGGNRVLSAKGKSNGGPVFPRFVNADDESSPGLLTYLVAAPVDSNTHLGGCNTLPNCNVKFSHYDYGGRLAKITTTLPIPPLEELLATCEGGADGYARVPCIFSSGLFTLRAGTGTL